MIIDLYSLKNKFKYYYEDENGNKNSYEHIFVISINNECIKFYK